MFRLMRDRRVLLSAAAILALLAIAMWPETVDVDVSSVTRGTLTVTVNEEGRTRVRDRFVVSAPVAGRVLRLDVEPGDAVRRGDIVARLQPGMSPLIDARALAEARAAVQSARAAFGRAEAEQRRADAALAHAERESQRTRGLVDAGALPAQELEARQAEARVAREAATAAAFAVRAASADIDQVAARLAAPSGLRDDAVVTVRAPINGVILRRLHESETMVPAGEPLVEIGDPTQLEVVVDLLSTDAARVRQGARALIEVWREEPPLDARVRRVEPSGFTKVSALGVEEQRVNVILDLDPVFGEDAIVLGDAYRVDVGVVVLEVRDAVLVPASALFRDGNRWAVYEVRDGRAHRTFVEIGAQTPQAAEVVSGITAHAQVVVHPGERVFDGVRVRAAG
jgi:HlyD family secretion protein